MHRFMSFLAPVVTVLMVACGGNAVQPAATAVAAKTATPTPTPTATPTPFTETAKFEVNVGAPPTEGWMWVLGELKTAADPRPFPTTKHEDPWLFYTIAGTHELTSAGKTEALTAGGGFWLLPNTDHAHRITPQSRVLVSQLKNRPPESVHQSAKVLVSDKPLGLKAGTPATLRVREVTLVPGARLPEARANEHSVAYVVDGTLTSRVGGVAQQVTAGKAIEWRPSVTHDASNEGTAPLRFVLIDVRQ